MLLALVVLFQKKLCAEKENTLQHVHEKVAHIRSALMVEVKKVRICCICRSVPPAFYSPPYLGLCFQPRAVS